jgi:transcriptional regulator with XRE-family HTH domain
MGARPSADEPSTIGEIIRRQREFAELSMRRLAAMAGISNPYLSQIERGLRAPSEQVLNALADSLQLSADLLRHTAEDGEQAQRTKAAIAADTDLTAAQRRALIEAYEAMRQVAASRYRGSRRSKSDEFPHVERSHR